jgi:hypothetical protein
MQRGTSLAWLGLASVLLGPAALADEAHDRWGVIEKHCFSCHNTTDWAGGAAFDSMSFDDIATDAKVWEAAVSKLRAGFMPPPGAASRPDQKAVDGLVSFLETRLDQAQVKASPGRVPLRRLNQREYANAVRDLLGVEADVISLLPADNRKEGFDNDAAHLQVSPSYLDQYLIAARTVAQQAVGNAKATPVVTTYGNKNDMVIALAAEGLPASGSQLIYKEGMPLGTRGGISFLHDFPAAGEYSLTIGDLASGRQIPRMEFSSTVIALLDGKEFYRTEVGGERDLKSIDQTQEKGVEAINARLRDIRFKAPAGQHRVAVTFLKRANIESEERFPSDPPEGGEERLAFLSAMQIRGPMKIDGFAGSPSRAKIFTCEAKQVSQETSCAKKIINNLAQRAFRRPVTAELLQPLMGFYDSGHRTGGLLGAAISGSLSKPVNLEAQVRRMLADPKATALSTDFGFQWLNMAKLAEIEPDTRLFPNASDTLDARPLFRRELALFLDSVMRSDQSVMSLLTADYTYLNETLAQIYGIATVKGGQFQRVTLPDSKRHGLLGKGAVLMVTSYPNRTAPVLRGAWILDRLLGTPPYQPPPGVGDLKPVIGKPATLRERFEQHSRNKTCFACHGVMDPLGFALENFDTIGQFRTRDPDTGEAVDTAGVLPNGTKINGPDDLRRALAADPAQFVQSLTRHLMTYALGRPVDYQDMPVVRDIARKAARDNYQFASIVSGIVASDAFRRRDPAPAAATVTANAGGQ